MWERRLKEVNRCCRSRDLIRVCYRETNLPIVQRRIYSTQIIVSQYKKAYRPRIAFHSLKNKFKDIKWWTFLLISSQNFTHLKLKVTFNKMLFLPKLKVLLPLRHIKRLKTNKINTLVITFTRKFIRETEVVSLIIE